MRRLAALAACLALLGACTTSQVSRNTALDRTSPSGLVVAGLRLESAYPATIALVLMPFPDDGTRSPVTLYRETDYLGGEGTTVMEYLTATVAPGDYVVALASAKYRHRDLGLCQNATVRFRAAPGTVSYIGDYTFRFSEAGTLGIREFTGLRRSRDEAAARAAMAQFPNVRAETVAVTLLPAQAELRRVTGGLLNVETTQCRPVG